MLPLGLKKFLCGFIPCRKTRKKVRDRTVFRHRYVSAHRKCRMGEGSFANEGFHVARRDTVIGKYCSIARNVRIGTGRHPTDWLSTHPFQYKECLCGPSLPPGSRRVFADDPPCRIGDDVWIGLDAVIMDGISIGSGAIVGAGAVVTRDVPPYAIVGGVPAKVIRYRFSPEIIASLLELRWWDLPLEQLRGLPFDDVEKCIAELRKIRAAYPERSDGPEASAADKTVSK